MCGLCTSYENLSDVEKNAKKLAQEAKENDKYQVIKPKFLQPMKLLALIYSSFNFASRKILFYARRLNNYNLTVYSLGTRRGFSYLWNQCVANRVSNEIGSC